MTHSDAFGFQLDEVLKLLQPYELPLLQQFDQLLVSLGFLLIALNGDLRGEGRRRVDLLLLRSRAS